MILTAFFMLVSQEVAAESANSTAAQPQQVEAPAAPQQVENSVQVEKEIIYKKETVVDLSGSQVNGENQLPPAFFVTKNLTPKAKSLLEERLRFNLKYYNEMGF